MANMGFIGPGRMGQPMIERLADGGHSVVVHARREERRLQLRQAGHTAVADISAVAEHADVVVACLFSDDQLGEVGPAVIEALSPGATFVSHVTGTVTTIQRLAELGQARKINVVDAPVSGTAEDIKHGRLTVLVGGPDTAIERCTEVVGAYADPVPLSAKIM